MRETATIAIIDDDIDFQNLVKLTLEREGFLVSCFTSPVGFLKNAQLREDKQKSQGEKSEFEYDLVISDLKMPEMDGLQLVKKMRNFWDIGEDLPIIFITAHGSLETAVEAIRMGAFDYLLKPIDMTELKVSVRRALRFNELTRQNVILRNEVKKQWQWQGIVGKSSRMKSVFDLIQRVADTEANVLITGESGTGKELVARSLHASGRRRDEAFIAINCSAIPENLLESELFGHGKGAFTGAAQVKKGLFEEADGGTIFLDEIGDMAPALQAKLLRVLQDRKIRPVGETKDKKINIRIISATHRNLREEIKKDNFREDLYYRLSVFPIGLPALRERKEDIPVLAEYFLKKFSASHDRNIKGFSGEAMEKLLQHSWPGNVRELENTVERAVVLTEGPLVEESGVFIEQEEQEGYGAEGEEFESNLLPEDVPLRELERQYIQHILKKSGGVKEKAARVLGIDRKTLYRKEKDYGLRM
jgi:DNA-binding NtrC family response regulator